MSRGGWTAWPIVIVILVLGGVTIVAFAFVGQGGTPNSLHLGPTGLVLREGVKATVDVGLVLNHPLPGGTSTVSWKVDIDEDDYPFDDDLDDSVTVSYTPGDAYAKGSFQLECRNLRATGFFDLHGDDGVSTNESVHYVHAEGPGDNSRNIVVSCTANRDTTRGTGG